MTLEADGRADGVRTEIAEAAEGVVLRAGDERDGDAVEFEGADLLREEAEGLGGAGAAEDIGYTALFLASDLSSYMTGTVLEVTGGRHV